jgi:hypothetical protein
MKLFGDDAIATLLNKIKAKFNSLSTVATTGSYNDLSDKPTIPSVGNGRITVTQGGTTKGTFTVNQTGATTIELTDNDTHYASGTVVTNDATKTGNYAAALTNGNVYLNHVENGAVKNSHQITGAGATTVTSDASGNIIITSTDNNTTYGVATTSADGLMSSTDKSKLDNVDLNATSIPFIAGTQTAATGSWAGTTSEISELKDGQTIRYWLPYNGSGNATLNLTLSDGTTTGAINCYRTGTSRISTHYSAGNVIVLTYRSNVSIAGSSTTYTGWWAEADYYSTSATQVQFSSNIRCGTTAIVSGNIIVGKDGLYSHLKLGNAFDITYPILLAGSAISASVTGSNNYTDINFNINTTQSMTLTACKPVFIKGNLSGTTFTPISTTPLTQDIPTSADAYEYILLGVAYSSSSMRLIYNHPIFAYRGGAFGQITGKEITDLSASGKTITYTRGDGSTGTITTQDTDTTYSAGTGLSLSGTTFNHSNSVTAGTAQGDTSKTLTFGGTFKIPTVTYDAQGHVTGKGTTTMTMPANPNTDTKVTQTLTNSSASYPLLLAPAAQTTTTTTTACFASGVTLQPNTKTIAANISGNAGTASKWATARNINGMLVQGDANRVNYGTCSTAAATAAKVVDCTGFELVTGAEITVKFTVTNTATQPTLNVNGTGAQTIYYRGNYISPSYLAANRTYTFRYSGTGYDLVGDLDTDTNSDTKVSQTLVSDNASYPLLLAPSGQTATTTTTARFDSGVTLNPSTNTIAANVSGSAAKVANALTVQANGTSLYTYDGSAAKTINIKAGSNITITSDNSGNIIINSSSDSSGDAGVIVYQAESGGLYCDGSTAKHLRVNACEIQDNNPNGYYKRFRFYCQGYYGLVCVDMPLDREHPAYGATNGTRYGGVIFPTAENGNINSTGIGPSNHMYYELKWKVTKDSGYWTVQVIDSGWLGLNAGKTTNDDYTGNASTSNAGTGYVSWNQRHNNSYCIYKIVAYTI